MVPRPGITLLNSLASNNLAVEQSSKKSLDVAEESLFCLLGRRCGTGRRNCCFCFYRHVCWLFRKNGRVDLFLHKKYIRQCRELYFCHSIRRCSSCPGAEDKRRIYLDLHLARLFLRRG